MNSYTTPEGQLSLWLLRNGAPPQGVTVTLVDGATIMCDRLSGPCVLPAGQRLDYPEAPDVPIDQREWGVLVSPQTECLAKLVVSTAAILIVEYPIT